MAPRINIYNPITEKETKVNPYGRTAKNIYRIYIEDLKTDPATILPDNLTYNKGRFVKVTPVEDVKNVRRITYAKVKADIGLTENGVQPSTMPYFRKIMKTYAGQTIKVVKRYSNVDLDFDIDEDVFEILGIEQQEESEVFVIPQKGFSKWWDKHSFFFWLDSDIELFDNWNEKYLDNPKLQAQLLILTLDKVNKEDFNQYFLDGITHCFFHPIKEWANRCEAESKSKSAKKRYKTIDKKVSKYIEKYPKGIPEEDLSNVCNDLQISVEIDLPSTLWRDNKFIEVESQKKALKKFRFINTRLNHIELNEVTNKDDYTEVNKKEIRKIFRESHEKGEFILWKENKEGVTQINTLSKIFKLKDENSYQELAKRFDEEYNFSNYKIEKNANEALTDFLEDGLNCNQSITFMPECEYIDPMHYLELFLNEPDEYFETKEDIEKKPDLDQPSYHEKLKVFEWIDNLGKLNHIDIRKAYTQGKNCSMYQGYLGKITDFRKTDKIVGLGIYKVQNIKFNGCDAIQKMKCFHNNLCYTSPELEFYKSIGITFDIVMGCWGTGFDFEFPDYMYEKEGGVAHYCKWYGCLMKINEKERYNFDCKNIDFAKLNAYNSTDCIRYNYNEDAGIIEYDKKYVYHSYHIASFISSYARITLLEQVLKFKDFNQIVSVVVDGIYYRGEVEVGELFSDKEQKSLKSNIYTDEYVSAYGGDDIEDYEGKVGDYRDDNKVEVHLGAGGCGKTHAQLVDKGFVNPLFIAPSWKLARNKKTEYGIDSTTFFHCLDNDPDKWRPLERRFSVFIVDEISMLSNEAKEKLLKRFPEHKIIFCGDVGFQLPPIEGTEFKVGDLPVFHHTTNYRCQCKELEKRLLFLRKLIKDGWDNLSCKVMINKMILQIVESDNIDYSVEDLILCATHDKKDKYTEKYKNLEKYSVLENCRDYCNGEIIIGKKPEKVRCELRHSWTIHAVQGETAKHKLFIDVDKMRSVKMLYTAMSRAKKLEQIVFIESAK